jgi:short-subunit dehydrogenase
MRKSDSSANSQSRDETQLRLWLEMNQVDLLLNAIGRSDRGPLEQLSDTDLHSMLNDNVLCTWNMTRMTLASLKRARGTIVNIGSLAGLVPAPGMGGYSVAKTALTAMSRQLRVELADVGVHVMLVCPGPIARHDSGSRYDQLAEQRGLADGASTAPGGGVKLKALDPKILCRKILLAAHRRKYELVTPVKASLLAGISNLWPRLSDWILKKYMRKQS